MAERVRFSPSPSGELHLGGARTALYNWLIARHTGGSFIVRIEDTDAERSDFAHGEAILDDLDWLGLTPDESPRVGGPHEPYLQSCRLDQHDAALEQLVASGSVYPCFCTPAQLEQARAEDVAMGRTPRYRGECDALGREERDRRVACGEPHAWRFAVGDPRRIVVADEVHGDVEFDTGDIVDFIVVRSDRSVTYDLACVVDDIAMQVTLVLRGDDHLSNTPRQMLLYEALGSKPPQFAHVPLVHGPDGRPLSKSRDASGIRVLRDEGYLPDAILNHLALIGWTDSEGREVATPDQIAERFDLSRISHAAGSHDPDRLDWFNSMHMRMREPAELVEEFAPLLEALPDWLDKEAVTGALRDEVRTGRALVEEALTVAQTPIPDDEGAAALSAAGVPEILVSVAQQLHDSSAEESRTMRDILKQLEVAPRIGMPAIRAALMGRTHGLPVDDLVRLLGKERAAERLRAASRFDTASERRG